MVFQLGNSLSSFDHLVRTFDIFSFISYTDECQAPLANGARCHLPAAGHFTVGGGLYRVPLCPLHVCMAMRTIMQILEHNEGDWQKVLEEACNEHFLGILLSELEKNDTPLLRPNNEI